MSHRAIVRVALCAAILSLGTAAAAEDARFRLSTGFDYSAGDYGAAADTEIWYVPLIARYERFPWTLKLTVPWIQITSPGGVVGGGEGLVVTGGGAGATATTTESGIGDVWASAGYSVEAIPAEWFFLDVTAKVKFPTADEDRGLGTGEYDWTLQADLFRSFGRLTPMLTVARKFKGDPPGLTIDDVWYLSGGAAWRFSDTTSAGATLDFQEASTAAADDQLELFGYLSHRLTPAWSLTAYGYAGFTDGSPDEGVGLTIGYRFGQR